MGETGYEAYRYSDAVLIVFGILGNILVVISILRQKNVFEEQLLLYCFTTGVL